jgi:metal-dependent amidase/aminoacylase/carboxypeptidase family protein
VEIAAKTAIGLLGEEDVILDPDPTMGSEDFAYMLKAKPGCYVFLGTASSDQDPTLHNPHYDFNDDALPIGASYWARLVEDRLRA